MWSLRPTLLVALLLALPAIPARAADFAFQPVDLHRIDLPPAVTSAGWPVFTTDGDHVLFFSTTAGTSGGNTGKGLTAELWITGLDGQGARCLSCGLANTPLSQGEGVISPMPDGRRVFFGSFYQPGFSTYGVLECTPSVADCRSARVSPVDFSPAQSALVPPSGLGLPQVSLGGTYSAKLAQDGVHIGFSDIRTDAIEIMVVGRLERGGGGYRVVDPKVINPAGPTSVDDPDPTHWSDGGALYEFKTFTDGGAKATYVQVGSTSLSPEVWSVELATGRRTRLTANPDYEEDHAVSPDGSLMAMWSNRTMHMTDWYNGLVPARDFIQGPAAVMGLGINSSNKRCHGPVWLMPAAGDAGNTIAGQPIVDDSRKDTVVTNNLTGWPQWRPDGTMLGLNTTVTTPGSGYPAHAPYVLIARFPARRPSRPEPVVSSAVGGWATTPAAYRSSFAYDTTRTFAGPEGGSVTVSYGGLPGLAAGRWTETYDRYREDGSEVSGSVVITGSALFGTYEKHLRMTGRHTGRTDVSFDSAGRVQGSSTLDGQTVSGPSPEQLAKQDCGRILPRKPQLDVAMRRLADGRLRVRVTSTVRAAGPAGLDPDTRPVTHASVVLAGVRATTGADGRAVLRVAGRGGLLTATAGDTLLPARVRVAAAPRLLVRRLAGGRVRLTVASAPRGTRQVRFVLAGRRVAIDRRAPFTVVARVRPGERRVRATAVLVAADGRRFTLPAG